MVYHIVIISAPTTTHVQYQSKSELVADALRRMIETGELGPGAHLRQRDVAELLGVSPTPVREAFRRKRSQFASNYDMVWVAKQSAATVRYADVMAEMDVMSRRLSPRPSGPEGARRPSGPEPSPGSAC